jgi:hypothetical protein
MSANQTRVNPSSPCASVFYLGSVFDQALSSSGAFDLVHPTGF